MFLSGFICSDWCESCQNKVALLQVKVLRESRVNRMEDKTGSSFNLKVLNSSAGDWKWAAAVRDSAAAEGGADSFIFNLKLLSSAGGASRFLLSHCKAGACCFCQYIFNEPQERNDHTNKQTDAVKLYQSGTTENSTQDDDMWCFQWLQDSLTI